MKKIGYFVLLAVLTVCVFMVPDFANASGGEEQALGILERVLDVIANFFDKIFKSLADAVKSLWADEAASH